MKASLKLSKAIAETRSLLCVGLDPEIHKLPLSVDKSTKGLVEFCTGIINSTKDYAAAYKINTAFFEQYGAKGIEAMEEVFAAVPSERFLIADAKRGDIGNTSKAYSKAFFEALNSDAITVSPYMGSDSIEPFLEYENKMVFILALTSNKGSADFQRIKFSGKELYKSVIETALNWQRRAEIGFVAGATHPLDIASIRDITGCTLLIPGIGAQGGDAEAVLKANGDFPAIINSSRAIIYASNEEDFAEKAAIAAKSTNELLNNYL